MGTSKKQKKREWLRYRDFVLSPYGVIKIKSLGYILNGEPWFVGIDVCTALGISNNRDALGKLDDDEKTTVALTDSQPGTGAQRISLISESGMFTLVLSCRDAVKQGTLPHRFRKWVASDVLPSIRKTGKYEHPQYNPQAAELFNDDNTRCLTHLVWSMANGFHFDRTWTQAIWYALRRVTGVPSPQHFDIRQIPLLAEECRRIYSITNTLKGAIFDAEKQTIRRVLRHREDEAIVLGEMQQMLEETTQQHYGFMTHALEKWQQANVSQFLQRH